MNTFEQIWSEKSEEAKARIEKEIMDANIQEPKILKKKRSLWLVPRFMKCLLKVHKSNG